MLDPPTENAGDEGVSSRAFFAVLGATVALLVAVTVTIVVVAGASGGDARHVNASTSGSPTHGAVAPLDLSTVSAQVAGHYRYAQAHMTDYQQIPCWCGCEQFLGHRNLADCFVRADGQGFEAHAAGCGVCNGEAAIAEQMLDQGHSPADAKATVDRQFGTTAITTPPNT